MIKKIIQVGGKIIIEYSCSMLIVGGAMLVMGNLYRFGKELGQDIYTLKAIREKRGRVRK
jgi:hypothetical protein